MDELDEAEQEFVAMMRENADDLDISITCRDGRWRVTMSVPAGPRLGGTGEGASFSAAWDDLAGFRGGASNLSNVVAFKP